MQSANEQIHRVQVTIEYAKQVVAFGEALERLKHNKDFQLVIDQGYFTDEARRLTLLSADPNMQDESNQTSIQHAIRGIGELHTYFLLKERLCAQMTKDLTVYQEGLDELHAADAAGQLDEDDTDPNAGGLE